MVVHWLRTAPAPARLLVAVTLLAGMVAGLSFVPLIQADNLRPSARPARPDAARPAARPEDPKPAEEPGPAPPPAKSDLWIDVDLSEQQAAVQEGDRTIKAMVISSGAPGYETPQGVFSLQNRGEWFYSGKYQEGAKWWVSFRDWGTYLFHSVAMDEQRRVIPEEAAKLGTPASHGCVRLTEEDAKWIYDHLPQGTKVVIHA